ncbi:MAG: ferrochelatase, partial [Thermoguttaceae bacterium]|nr:ferrochelatase [Thermoguttaceae bacterium]
MKKFDSLLIYAYGGPESMEDVEPFLRNIAQGKRISEKRMAEVLAHYALFDGRSPMNGTIRKFMRLWAENVPEVPVFFGCRYAKPALKETLRQMAEEGKRRPLVFIPSPFGGYLTTYLEKWTQVRDELSEELGEDVFSEAQFFPPFSENAHFLDAAEAVISETLKSLPAEQQT